MAGVLVVKAAATATAAATAQIENSKTRGRLGGVPVVGNSTLGSMLGSHLLMEQKKPYEL